MKKVVLALVAVLVASLALPATAALAAAPSFAATGTLAQTSPGVLTPFPGGISIAGEKFAGAFTSGSGPHSKQLEGSSFQVTQDATLYFTGFDPGTGAISFLGSVSGTFTIQKQTGKQVHTMTGSYAGMVSGTLTPLPPYYGLYSLGGQNNSSWVVTGATGMFNSLKDTSGTLTASLGGIFPGGETATVTVTGSK